MQTELSSSLPSRPVLAHQKAPRDYVVEHFAWLKARNPRFSLRAWARMMGLRDHSLLVLLFNGKREIRPQHVDFLLRGLNLTEDERRRFKMLVQAANSKDEEEKLLLLGEVSSSEAHELELDQFRLVSHWVHFAILEMTGLKGFAPDPEWICGRLDPPVTLSEARSAWDRLVRMGLVKERKGKWTKTNKALTTSGKSASQAVRFHHKQIVDLAKRAIDTQTIQQRILNSCTLAIDSRKLPQAQELILEFRRKMEALLDSGSSDEIYQLSVQFFCLSRGKNES